jgi:hypothetical protein
MYEGAYFVSFHEGDATYGFHLILLDPSRSSQATLVGSCTC